MKLFKRKSRFIFELTGYGDWEEVILYDPHELVKFMIDEDYRFRNDYKQNTITITKIRNNLEGKIYFAKQFNLPQDEGFNWLEALSPFFTKKVLPYDLESSDSAESLAINTSHSDNNEKSEPLTLEDFEADLQMNEISQSNQKESTLEETIKPDMIQLSKSDFEALQVTIEKQKAENVRLREQISYHENNDTETVSSIPTQKEFQDDSLLDPLSQSVNQQNTSEEETTDNVVSSEIPSGIKAELDQELSQFLQSETEQIEVEINQLDKREQISKIVTKQLSKEEHEQIEKLRKKWGDTKNEQLIEEEIRHKKRIEDINSHCDTKLKEEEGAIHISFNKKIADYTQREYDKQTNQLIHILEAKMEELRQTVT